VVSVYYKPSGYHEATLADSKCFVIIIICRWHMYHGIDCNLPLSLFARESCINKFLLQICEKCTGGRGPKPHWGSSWRSPRPLSQLGRGTPVPMPHPPRTLRHLNSILMLPVEVCPRWFRAGYGPDSASYSRLNEKWVPTTESAIMLWSEGRKAHSFVWQVNCVIDYKTKRAIPECPVHGNRSEQTSFPVLNHYE